MKKIYSILFIFLVALFAVSCSNDFDKAGEVGYLKLELTTLVSTNTRTVAPEDYVPKKLHVVLKRGATIVLESDYENGVFSNSNMQGNITLEAGTYTITAQSANWDGSGSGFGVPFYHGETTVEVKSRTLQEASLTCTQANVKVTINWDKSFKDNFTEAQASVISAGDPATSESPILFTMGEDRGSAYFPVGNLKVHVSVKNKGGDWHGQDNEITDVQARQHCIINYKVAESGTQGRVEVVIDDASNSYIYNVELPQESGILLEAKPVTDLTPDFKDNFIERNYALLTGFGMGDNMEKEKVVLRYRLKNANEWTVVENDDLIVEDLEEGVNFSYKFMDVVFGTTYEYQFYHNDPENSLESNTQSFTVTGEALYNGGFELWHDEGKASYPTESASVKYWSSSNPGSASFGGNVTTAEETIKHGGNYSAKLQSKYIVIKFAAASIYTGNFAGLVGTNGAKLDWGVPFTSRPRSLKGFMMYQPQSVNRVSSNAPADAPKSGELDHCQIYCTLLTEQLHVDNTKIEETFPKYDGTDSRVIAYGEKTVKETQSDWTEFDIPLHYFNTTTKPSYLLIVCSSSKYGDYFHGAGNNDSGSTLYLDDFELVY
ncbi:MAG: PCMD domain-containing protein [Prevotellaceae bacterium]|nr:PCMD domain-containing protein [Prevotellaceae bacterium]